MALGFTVYNRSDDTVYCSITNKTGGSDAWYELPPGTNETWGRYGWEDISFKNLDDTKRKSLWVNRGSPATVNFDGFDKDLVIHNDYQPDPGFAVNNCTDKAVFCFISAYSGGSDGWYELQPGEKDFTWRRDGWEMVVFKDQDDTERKGVYVNNRGSLTKMDFHGFDKDVILHDPPASFILEEHYAEAICIADRSHAAQSSRASNPGGLTASVYKVNTLEFLTTGTKVDLNNHNQVYTLALLINHLKYGLAEPAVVVSVGSEWVKVAAYSCEFDAIVVLGFPTKAIDLIAPGKQRPVTGERLLVVSQFTSRDAIRQGVQGDITVGPRTYNKWYNFHPLVAQFVTDDSQAPIWKERLAAVEEDLWGRLWERWLWWKKRHGENYFRLGAPSKIRLIATNHISMGSPDV